MTPEEADKFYKPWTVSWGLYCNSPYVKLGPLTVCWFRWPVAGDWEGGKLIFEIHWRNRLKWRWPELE